MRCLDVLHYELLLCLEMGQMCSRCLEDLNGQGHGSHTIECYLRTIVKPLWRLPPSEAKKPSG